MTPAETYKRYEEIRDRLEAGGLSYDERKDLDKQWHEAILGIIPEVGRGCTICYWSDKRAATITKVEYTKAGKPKAVEVTHNKVKCLDWFANEYEILPELMSVTLTGLRSARTDAGTRRARKRRRTRSS